MMNTISGSEDLDAIKMAQDRLIEDFSFFDDWAERYRHIIDLGKSLPELPDKEKTEDNLVRGCQSQVWVVIDKTDDGLMKIRATSDAMIVRGLIAMLLQVYDGHLPQSIAKTPPQFIDDIGLKNHLSPTRNNGLLSMVRRIQDVASSIGK